MIPRLVVPTFVVLALSAVVLIACAPSSAVGIPSPAHGAVPVTGPAVLGPSDHVTGTYPGHCQAQGPRPDPACTPGSVRSDVTQQTLRTTVCTTGWTAAHRPPSRETDRLKVAAMAAYDVPFADMSTTELDHDVPLELGGSNDATNLWPERSDQPGHGFRNSKDGVENRLHDAVCAGRVPLSAARAAIAADWTSAGRVLGI